MGSQVRALLVDQTDTPITTAGGGLTTQGPVANLSTGTPNFFPISARFLTTPPTYTNTQIGELGMSSNGGLRVSMGARNTAGDSVSNSTTVGVSATDGVECLLKNSPYMFNSTTWDRSRTIQGAVADGTGLGVAAVAEAGGLFSNITTATTVNALKSGKGILHKIIVNTPVAGATITLYDSLTATGTKIGTITLPSVITGEVPLSLIYDLQFSTGLTIVTSAATDITVIYR